MNCNSITFLKIPKGIGKTIYLCLEADTGTSTGTKLVKM